MLSSLMLSRKPLDSLLGLAAANLLGVLQPGADSIHPEGFWKWDQSGIKPPGVHSSPPADRRRPPLWGRVSSERPARLQAPGLLPEPGRLDRLTVGRRRCRRQNIAARSERSKGRTQTASEGPGPGWLEPPSCGDDEADEEQAEHRPHLPAAGQRRPRQTV